MTGIVFLVHSLLLLSSILAALWDCYILLFSWHYNVEDGTCIHPMSEDLIFSKDDARCLTTKEEGHTHLWNMMKRVQSLDLTLEERVVSAALCLMNAGG